MSINGLDIDDAGLGTNNHGFYAPSSSSGAQEISNSNFNGLGTAILNNDVGTTISNTVVANGDVVAIGTQTLQIIN